MTYPPETKNGVVTSWIPFTTGWSDVLGCQTQYILYKGLTYEDTQVSSDKPTAKWVVTNEFVAYDPLWATIYSVTQCLPSEVVTWRSQFYYDQGGILRQAEPETKSSLLPLICPDAWSTVATFIKSVISTQVMCCSP